MTWVDLAVLPAQRGRPGRKARAAPMPQPTPPRSIAARAFDRTCGGTVNPSHLPGDDPVPPQWLYHPPGQDGTYQIPRPGLDTYLTAQREDTSR